MGVYRNSTLTFDVKDQQEAEDKVDMLLSAIIAKNKKDVAILHSINDKDKGFFIRFDSSKGRPDYIEGPYFPADKDGNPYPTWQYSHHDLIYSFYLEKAKDEPYRTDILMGVESGNPISIGDLTIEGKKDGGYQIQLYDFDKFFKNGLENALDKYGDFIKFGMEIGDCHLVCHDEGFGDSPGVTNWDITIHTPPLKKDLDKEYNKLIKKLAKNPVQTIDTKLNIDKLPKAVDFEFRVHVFGIAKGDTSDLGMVSRMFGGTSEEQQAKEEIEHQKLRDAMKEVSAYLKPVLDSGKFMQPDLGDFADKDALYFSNENKNEFLIIRNRYYYKQNENTIVIKGVTNQKMAEKLKKAIESIDKNKTNGIYKMENQYVPYGLYEIYDINKTQVNALYDSKKEEYEKWALDMVEKNSEKSVQENGSRFVTCPKFDEEFQEAHCIDYRDPGSIDKVKSVARARGDEIYKGLVLSNKLETQSSLVLGNNIVALVKPQKDFYFLENAGRLIKQDNGYSYFSNCLHQIKSPEGEIMFSWDYRDNNIPYKEDKYHLPITFNKEEFINENRDKLETYHRLMKEGKTDTQEAKNIEASVLTALKEKAEKAVALDKELEAKQRDREYVERLAKEEEKRNAIKQSGKETFLSKAQWGLVKAGEIFVKKNDIRRADGELMLFERDWKDQRKALSQWMFALKKRGFGKDRDNSNSNE